MIKDNCQGAFFQGILIDSTLFNRILFECSQITLAFIYNYYGHWWWWNFILTVKNTKKRTETEWEWIKKLYIMSGGDATVIIYNFYYSQVLGNKTLKIISDGISIKVSKFP